MLKAAERYEKYFSQKASLFFCVSDKMREDLNKKWNIQAITLYDRPVRPVPKDVDKNTFLNKYNQSPLN